MNDEELKLDSNSRLGPLERGVRRELGTKEWTQQGNVVVSDAGALPLTHGFFLTEWEAKAEKERIEKELPEHLRKDLRVRPCMLVFIDA